MGSVVKKTHVKLESCGDDLRVFTLGPVQSLWHTRKEGGAGNPVDSTVASSPTLPAAPHCVCSQQLALSLPLSLSLCVPRAACCITDHSRRVYRYQLHAATYSKGRCRSSSSSSSSYSSRATPLCGKRRAGWWKLGFLPESCVV